MTRANLSLTEIVKFRAPIGFGSAITRVAAKENLSASALMRQVLTEKLRLAEPFASGCKETTSMRELALSLARAAGEAR